MLWTVSYPEAPRQESVGRWGCGRLVSLLLPWILLVVPGCRQQGLIEASPDIREAAESPSESVDAGMAWATRAGAGWGGVWSVGSQPLACLVELRHEERHVRAVRPWTPGVLGRSGAWRMWSSRLVW